MKRLFPPAPDKQKISDWSIDVKFLRAIESATDPILENISAIPSFEQIEAVLLVLEHQDNSGQDVFDDYLAKAPYKENRIKELSGTWFNNSIIEPPGAENKLLDAYRFVFSRHFLKDAKLIAALESWQPDIYKLISSDIKSGS